MRFLYKCRLYIKGNDYTLNCEPLNGKGDRRTIVFNGTRKWFRKQLIKMQANDRIEDPPSKNRQKKYDSMISDALHSVDNLIYIFSNKLPNKMKIIESFYNSNLDAKTYIEVKLEESRNV